MSNGGISGSGVSSIFLAHSLTFDVLHLMFVVLYVVCFLVHLLMFVVVASIFVL